MSQAGRNCFKSIRGGRRFARCRAACSEYEIRCRESIGIRVQNCDLNIRERYEDILSALLNRIERCQKIFPVIDHDAVLTLSVIGDRIATITSFELERIPSSTARKFITTPTANKRIFTAAAIQFVFAAASSQQILTAPPH